MATSSKKVGGATSVTLERKMELLLEARKTRIEWIQSSSYPFIENVNCNDAVDDDDDGSCISNDGNVKDDGMKVIRNVCQEIQLPSAIPIIDLLLEKAKDGNNINDTTCADSNTTSNVTKELLCSKLQSKLPSLKLDQSEDSNNNIDVPINTTLSSYEISMEQHMNKTEDQIFLFYYKDVLEKLCLPECSDIVQGMKHFEQSFHDLSNQLQLKLKQSHGDKVRKYSTTSIKSNDKDDSQSTRKNSSTSSTAPTKKKQKNANDHLSTLAIRLQKYISKLYDTLTTHIAWRDNVISSETKMMLETFIYSKCYVCIQPILSMVEVNHNDYDDDTDKDDTSILRLGDDEAKMSKRLEFLQFVEPKHLDMHSIVNENDNDDIPWQSKLDLSKPISHVKSLDAMYSPAQMLRCILEIYRCVNEALSESLNMAKSKAASSTNENGDGNDIDGGSSKSKGTPNVSADDVLPSLILSVIHARPSRIITNLTFLDKFATDEQIRGEAGYAFTNLFSAVQFIKELDLQLEDEYDDDSNTESGKVDDENQQSTKRKSGQPTLSMSVQLLKEKMHQFRQDCKAKEEAKTVVKEKEGTSVDEGESKEVSTSTESKKYEVEEFQRIEIPSHEVKTARLRGENIDEWATRWFQNQLSLNSSNDGVINKIQEAKALDVSPVDGFSRSYSFLATDAKDVKVSDIPELLREYKMLVRTTETLLMERNSLIQESKQKEVALKRESLENSLERVLDNSS